MPLNSPSADKVFFVKYGKWWSSVAAGREIHPDLTSLVVKGHVIAVNLVKKKATICFPALQNTSQKSFRWFQNPFVKESMLPNEKELTLKLILEREGMEWHPMFLLISGRLYFIKDLLRQL